MDAAEEQLGAVRLQDLLLLQERDDDGHRAQAQRRGARGAGARVGAVQRQQVCRVHGQDYGQARQGDFEKASPEHDHKHVTFDVLCMPPRWWAHLQGLPQGHVMPQVGFLCTDANFQ